MYRKKREEKLKNDMLFSYYYNMIECLLMSKIKLKNLPKNMYTEYALKPLLRGGIGAFAITENGDYFTAFPTLSGVTAYPNVSKYAKLVNPISSTKDLLIGEEIAVGYNNYNHTPEYSIYWYAMMLTEIDKSLEVNVLNTRVSPVVGVNDSKQAKEFDRLFENIYNGKPKSITLNKTFGEQIKEDSTKENITDKMLINLTQPNHVDKIQYLSKFHDDLIRRLMTFHGIPMNTTGKMAQITIDELKESDLYSMIYTGQQVELLERYINDINRIFGLNIDYEYNKAWSRFDSKNNEDEEVNEDDSIRTLQEESDEQ